MSKYLNFLFSGSLLKIAPKLFKYKKLSLFEKYKENLSGQVQNVVKHKSFYSQNSLALGSALIRTMFIPEDYLDSSDNRRIALTRQKKFRFGAFVVW